MSEENNTKALGKGVVFYPIKYIHKEIILDSYIEGVTQGGKEAVAYIIPNESFIHSASNSDSASTIPLVSEFGKTSLRAKNPCLASESNSKENPAGILLLEQVSVSSERKDIHGDKLVLVAKWASVIAIGDPSSRSAIGIGYLEINVAGKPDDELVALEMELKKLKESISNNLVSPMEAEDKLRSLYSLIIGKKNKKFTAVIMYPEKTYMMKEKNIEIYKKALKRALVSKTKDGLYGGCMVRVRSGNDVLIDTSYMCNHRYDYKNKRVDNIDTVIQEFLKYGGLKAFNNGFNPGNTLELIPTLRINCAFNGNNHFSAEMERSPIGTSKILKTYVEPWDRESPELKFTKNKSSTFSDVACRLSLLEGGATVGNILLSAIHSFSAPKGNIYTVDNKGKSKYRIVRL